MTASTSPSSAISRNRYSPLLDVPLLGFRIALAITLFEILILVSQPLFLRTFAGGFVTFGFFAVNGIGMLIRAAVLFSMYPGKAPNIYFLRAFKTDRKTITLRRNIEAILGLNFRLAGIRSPRLRANWVWQTIHFPIVALRYLGSNYFELEGGDDWLLRLTASLAKARAVIIDVREWTPGVSHEVLLSARAMGLSRCALLVSNDPRNSPPQQALDELKGALIVPIDDESQVEALEPLRLWSEQIPLSPSGPNEPALNYAREHSPPHLRDSPPLWYRHWFRILIMAIGTVSVTSVVGLLGLIATGWLKTVIEDTSVAFAIGMGAFVIVVIYRRLRIAIRFTAINRTASKWA